MRFVDSIRALGTLGPSLDGLGGLWGRLEGVLGCSCVLGLADSWPVLGSRFVDSIHRLDLLMRFVDSLIRFVVRSPIRLGDWIRQLCTNSTTPPGGMREAIKYGLRP